MNAYNVEFTDTFGGEANYSRELMRRAKAAMGLTGIRGRVDHHGDMIEFRPYRSCTVMFITFDYS